MDELPRSEYGFYDAGTPLFLIATQRPGWEFHYWYDQDDLDDGLIHHRGAVRDNPTVILMEEQQWIRAYFH